MVAHLDELLDPGVFDDYGPNGLQVPGADEVDVVATGVSAHRELFERALAEGAQLVICHHGLFWDAQPRALTPALKARLATLFEADLSLAAYHLPLDAHPEVGNNALICASLGLERSEKFGDVGWIGRAAEAIARDDLVERCRSAFGQDPIVFPDGPEEVRSVGIVSGGGALALGE